MYRSTRYATLDLYCNTLCFVLGNVTTRGLIAMMVRLIMNRNDHYYPKYTCTELLWVICWLIRPILALNCLLKTEQGEPEAVIPWLYPYNIFLKLIADCITGTHCSPRLFCQTVHADLFNSHMIWCCQIESFDLCIEDKMFRSLDQLKSNWNIVAKKVIS